MPSKKRSDARSSRSARQREFLVFFLDRNLGKKQVAEALRAQGVTVEVHDDHFAADEPDVRWLAEIGLRRWVVLTRDYRLRFRPHELAALRSAKVRAFIARAGNLSGPDLAKLFVDSLPKITQYANDHQPPFIFRITASGQFTKIDL